jgi:hypothetical protein
MDMPVIVASGMNQQALTCESGLQLAATLPKPYTKKELVDLVHSVLFTAPV